MYFLVPIKSTTTTRVAGEGGGGGVAQDGDPKQWGKEGKKKKQKKTFKRFYRANQNIRIINVFLESLLSESFPSWESQST